MTVPARRGPKPSPARRETLIRSALQQFAKKGVDASTTRDIAAGAETTERTLFKHFGSKAALVQAAIETVTAEFMDAPHFGRVYDLRPFTRDEFSLWHRAFLRDRVEAAHRAPDSYRILFSELLRDADFRTNYGARWMEAVYLPMAAKFAAMQSSGEIGRSQSPTALAGAFFSLNLGYLLTRFTLAPELSWDDELNIDAVTSMFLMIASGVSGRSVP